MPRAQCREVTLEYETFGNKRHPAVLLIMGLGAQMIVWPDKLCHLLAQEGYFVIRFDNRDIGLSTKLHHIPPPNLRSFLGHWLGMKLEAPYTLNDMAHDAIALLEHLGCSRAHIVGASMGGMIAQIIAGRFQDRVISLTSIMSSASSKNLLRPWHIKTGFRLFKFRRAGWEPFSLKMEMVRALSSQTHPPKEEDLKKRLKKALSRDTENKGSHRQLTAIMATPNRKKFTRLVKVPTLIIHGAEDRLIPPEYGKKNANLIPHSDFREIEGMAHDFPPPLVGYLAFVIAKHLRKSDDLDQSS